MRAPGGFLPAPATVRAMSTRKLIAAALATGLLILVASALQFFLAAR